MPPEIDSEEYLRLFFQENLLAEYHQPIFAESIIYHRDTDKCSDCWLL